VDAMTFRDGGTTTITVAPSIWSFERVTYTIDFSLPWDGRKRYMTCGSRRTQTRRLEIGCDEEVQIQQWLMESASRVVGRVPLEEFLRGNIKNPGKGKWLYALSFLSILHKERCLPSHGPDANSAGS
jgi:hypothetical protein